MMKLSKKADYGLIALKHLAMHNGHGSSSAADIAEVYRISTPLMAKVLQKLAKAGLVAARHGSSGGYTLARAAKDISALDAIRAIEGPLFITSCVTSRGECDVTTTCSIREPLRRVNDSILDVLAKVRISQMTDDAPVSEVVELRV
ncbi:MAG: SUF system Fe-S cluster assembly regulator [Candidatus Acidiferrales bacterium]